MHKLYKKGVDGHNSVPTANRPAGQRNAPITRYSLPLRHFGPRRIPTCTERTTDRDPMPMALSICSSALHWRWRLKCLLRIGRLEEQRGRGIAGTKKGFLIENRGKPGELIQPSPLVFTVNLKK